MDQRRFIECVQIFSAKLVLEVFGGGGAIWGFSEAVGFRVPSTVWFWRPCALVVGMIFFVRWIRQIQDYLVEMKMDRLGTLEEQVSMTSVTNGDDTADEKHDLALQRNIVTYT